MTTAPPLESILALPATRLLAADSHETYLYDGEPPLVYKQTSPKASRALPWPVRAIRAMHRVLASALLERIPMYRLRDTRTYDTAAVEQSVLDAWHTRGVPCVPVLERQPQALVFPYVKSKHFQSVLSSADFQAQPFAALLATIDAIRRAAYAAGEARLLHLDPHLKNFLWAEENAQALAIDPAIRHRPHLTIREADAHASIFTLYHLTMTAPDHRERYTMEFAGLFTPAERSRMRTLDGRFDTIAAAYFRSAAQGRALLGRPNPDHLGNLYTENNWRLVQHALHR